MKLRRDKAASLWRQPGYPAWLLTDTSFAITGSIYSFALSLLVILETGSAAQAGVVVSIGYISSGIFQLFGGQLQDFVDRRKLSIIKGIVGTVLYALAVFLLASNNFNFLSASVLAGAFGIRSGLFGNTTDLMLRSFLPGNLLPKAISVNQARDAVVEFGASPLAGALIELGKVFPFLCNTLLTLLGTVTSIFLPHDVIEEEENSQKTSSSLLSWHEYTVGFSLAIKSRMMRALSLSGNLSFIVFNAVITITVWETASKEHNAAFAGVISTSVAIGVFLGAVVATKLTQSVRGGRIAVTAFMLPLITTILLIFVDSTPGRIIAMLPAMILLPAGNAAMGSIQMLIIPNRKLGRYFAALGIIEFLFSAAVMAAAGFAYQHFGYLHTIIAASTIMGICIVHIVLTPEIRGIPRSDEYESFAKTIAV